MTSVLALGLLLISSECIGLGPNWPPSLLPNGTKVLDVVECFSFRIFLVTSSFQRLRYLKDYCVRLLYKITMSLPLLPFPWFGLLVPIPKLTLARSPGEFDLVSVLVAALCCTDWRLALPALGGAGARLPGTSKVLKSMLAGDVVSTTGLRTF